MLFLSVSLVFCLPVYCLHAGKVNNGLTVINIYSGLKKVNGKNGTENTDKSDKFFSQAENDDNFIKVTVVKPNRKKTNRPSYSEKDETTKSNYPKMGPRYSHTRPDQMELGLGNRPKNAENAQQYYEVPTNYEKSKSTNVYREPNSSGKSPSKIRLSQKRPQTMTNRPSGRTMERPKYQQEKKSNTHHSDMSPPKEKYVQRKEQEKEKPDFEIVPKYEMTEKYNEKPNWNKFVPFDQNPKSVPQFPAPEYKQKTNRNKNEEMNRNLRPMQETPQQQTKPPWLQNQRTTNHQITPLTNQETKKQFPDLETFKQPLRLFNPAHDETLPKFKIGHPVNTPYPEPTRPPIVQWNLQETNSSDFKEENKLRDMKPIQEPRYAIPFSHPSWSPTTQWTNSSNTGRKRIQEPKRYPIPLSQATPWLPYKPRTPQHSNSSFFKEGNMKRIQEPIYSQPASWLPHHRTTNEELTKPYSTVNTEIEVGHLHHKDQFDNRERIEFTSFEPAMRRPHNEDMKYENSKGLTRFEFVRKTDFPTRPTSLPQAINGFFNGNPVQEKDFGSSKEVNYGLSQPVRVF